MSKKRAFKRGQMKLSFGMIFSIILIIIFITVAFYAINKFLDIQETVQIGKFSTDLQEDVNKIWKSSQGSQPKEYPLPKKIEYICFVDYLSGKKGERLNLYDELEQDFFENENMFIYPISSAQGQSGKWIKNLNLEETTLSNNPLCFENTNGKIRIILKKDFGETLVTIEK